MNFNAKKFSELTAAQVYEILKSRSQIFMLEQGIRCLDMDDKDYDSFHFFYEQEGKILAYMRAFYVDEEKTCVKIGRVLSMEHKKGLGSALTRETFSYLKDVLGVKKVIVSAQIGAVGFYEKMGFEKTSDEYLEENIPHISMEFYLQN